MLRKRSFLAEAFAAIWTGKRTLPGVSLLVINEGVLPRKTFPAHLTRVRQFLRVALLVNVEDIFPRKTFPAHRTREGSLFCVDSHMSHQNASYFKTLTALGARKRPFSGVNSDMVDKHELLGERLPAL